MQRKVILITCLLISITTWTQVISGSFTELKNETLYLYGFKGFSSYPIDSATIDANGSFELKFSSENYGMGYLKSIDDKPLIIVLTNEDVSIEGEAPSYTETLHYKKGQENIAFSTYAKQHPKREQVLNAWDYLEKRYAEDPLFIQQKKPVKAIAKEKKRLKEEDKTFIEKLPDDSYVKWFIPIRKLVSNVSVVAQYKPEEIPTTRAELRAIDYGDPRLYTSGLFRETIENHVWFIENSSGPLDTVFADLNRSIDLMLEKIATDELLFNEVTDFLFNLLEKRSLFPSAEYLAQRVLNESSCNISDNVSKQLEAYRKMAVGATAPDIVFSKLTYYPEGISAKKVSELEADYYLVVFAAGWCPHCNEELPKIAENYNTWKANNIEVILVSLDTDTKEFARFAAPFPFISTTDLKKWDGTAATDYHVFGTPSYFMLDAERKILIRPKSADHAKAWIDFKIIGG